MLRCVALTQRESLPLAVLARQLTPKRTSLLLSVPYFVFLGGVLPPPPNINVPTFSSPLLCAGLSTLYRTGTLITNECYSSKRNLAAEPEVDTSSLNELLFKVFEAVNTDSASQMLTAAERAVMIPTSASVRVGLDLAGFPSLIRCSGTTTGSHVWGVTWYSVLSAYAVC